MDDTISRLDAIEALKICDNNEDGINCYGGQAGKPPGPCVRADESVFLMEWDEHLWARLRLPASC